MPITHSKVSAVSDNLAAPGLVQPSEWNAAHVIGALGTPAADGIVFPAVQVPAAGANTLDDYEEGLWTPALTFATPGTLNVVYGSRSGTYTKVGRMVHLIGGLQTSTFTLGTASGALRITGLPFAANVDSDAWVTQWGIYGEGWTVDASHPVLSGYVYPGTTYIQLGARGSGVGNTGLTQAHMPTGTLKDLNFSVVYRV